MKSRKPPQDIDEEQERVNLFVRKIRRGWWRWGFVIDYLVVALLLIGLVQIIEFKDACQKCTNVQLVNCPYSDLNFTLLFPNLSNSTPNKMTSNIPVFTIDDLRQTINSTKDKEIMILDSRITFKIDS